MFIPDNRDHLYFNAINHTKPHTYSRNMNSLPFILASLTVSAIAQTPATQLVERRLDVHQAIIKTWDLNKDGFLQQTENIVRMDAPFKDEALALALKLHDKDGDGQLSPQESIDGFKVAVHNDAGTKGEPGYEEKRAELQERIVGAKIVELHKKATAERISLAANDKNKDGKLSGEEQEAILEIELDALISKLDFFENLLPSGAWSDKAGFDGVLPEGSKESLILSVGKSRLLTEKADRDQNGWLSPGEKSAIHPPTPAERILTDTKGRQINATLIDASPQSLHLRVKDQKEIVIRLDTLSAADRSFIQEWAKLGK